MKTPADILDEQLAQDRVENPSQMRKIGRRIIKPLITVGVGITAAVLLHDTAHTSAQDTQTPKLTEIHKVVHIGDTIYDEGGKEVTLDSLWKVALYSGLGDPRAVLPELEKQLPKDAVNDTVFEGEEFILSDKAQIGEETITLPGEPR